MSRELKRVPLDFDWPVHKPWEGYVRPVEFDGTRCPDCDGDTMSAVARLVHERWYGNADFRPEDRGSTPFLPSDIAVIMQVTQKVLRNPDHFGTGTEAIAREAGRMAGIYNSYMSVHLNQEDVDMLTGKGVFDALVTRLGRPPTAREANEWSLQFVAGAPRAEYHVARAECEKAGVTDTCPRCAGKGEVFRDAGHQAACEAWEPTEPPSGGGYQMWRTSGIGTPMSPVFRTAGQLARWLGVTGASAFGSEPATADQWLAMINGSGHSPGLTVAGGKVASTIVAGRGFRLTSPPDAGIVRE